MKRFNAVLFDIDGTLLDTTELLFQAFEHTLGAHKQPGKTRKEIAKQIGKHINEIYQNLAPGMDPGILRQTHLEFQVKNLHLSKPYTNTKETLIKLKKAGVKTAAISNRFKTTSKTLQLAGILDHIDLIVRPEDVVNTKPHPEPVLKALEHFKLSTSQAVIVGDSHTDILTGKNAGVATIGVTYGFGGANIKESNPDFLVHDIAEIVPIILS